MRIGINAQKLSFANAYHAGGISRYTYHLLAELRCIPSPHVFEALAPRVPRDTVLAQTPSFRLRATGGSTERPALRIFWEQFALPVLARGRYDILHGLAFALPMAWRGPGVVTILDLSFLRHPAAFHRGNQLYLALSTRIAARKARRIVTISRHARDEIVSLLRVPAERVDVTYCAADDRFRPLPSSEVEAFRHRHELPREFILYLGTLEPRKNVATLLRAYSRMRRDWPKTPLLVLAGAPGWLYQHVYAEIERLELRNHVRLVGFVSGDEQPLWYNSATVFAYPSIYEGFGLPPLEAMACGTPVVVSDASSLPEVVGEAGMMVSPFDDRSLASSLHQVLEDETLAGRLRQAGQDRAAQFSWRRMALETLRCYDRVADQA